MSLALFTPFDRVLPGQRLPAYSLRSTSNQRVRSADLFGRRLVLAFTDGADDVSSRRMLTRLKEIYPTLVAYGVLVFAIAPVEADTGFLVEPGVEVPFPTLRDVAGSVHRQFGAIDWSGQPATSLFVTDRSERVIYRALTGLGERLPTGRDVLAMIQFDRLSPGYWLP